MRDAVIVDAVRTPVGKHNGALAGIHPVDLSSAVLKELIARTGVDPAVVDDLIWGCSAQVAEQAFVARNAILAAGWPDSVPGTNVERACGSSQQAIHFAAAGLVAGHYDVVIAGGVESMSRVPMGSNSGAADQFGAALAARYGGEVPYPVVSAELIAERWGLSRSVLDEYSLRSHLRATAASEAGSVRDQLVGLESLVPGTLDGDEGVRRDASLAAMGRLKPLLRPDGVITAGSSSQISDGSAAILMMTSDMARRLGLRPMARVHTAVVVGDDAVLMLTGPIKATEKAIRKAGLCLNDIGTFEVNEAFASVVLAWLADTGAPDQLVNPGGGAIAIGHPIGASGARIMTTMVHHMRRNRIARGLQTMCEGGGMANAIILELTP